MTINVRISVEHEIAGKRVAIYNQDSGPKGGNAKRSLVTQLTHKGEEYVGAIFDTRDLIIQEENV